MKKSSFSIKESFSIKLNIRIKFENMEIREILSKKTSNQ